MALQQITDWHLIGELADRPSARTGGQVPRVFIQTDSGGDGVGFYVDDGVTGSWTKTAELDSGGGAGVTDGDKGDITVSGSGAVWTVDNDAITYAKIQNVTSDRLLGRDTAGSGDTEEISVGGGLEFTGSGGIQRSALTGDVTASAGNNSTTIANDAVTYAKIQNVSATDRLLGRSTSGAGDVEEIACTAAGRALLDDADASAQRTTLGLAIGSNVQAFDATLSALAAFNTNGILTQTAADTFAGRTITGTSNQVNVSNGNGVSGNPTLSTPQDIHTAATPQFARVGLGAAADSTAELLLSGTAPEIKITDTTASAKSFSISVDGNKARLREPGSSVGYPMTLDLANNKVGINNDAPDAVFDVERNWGSSSAAFLMFTATSYGDASRFVIRRANGTMSAPTQVLNTQPIGNINFRGYHSGSAFSVGVAAITAIAEEDFTSTATGSGLAFFANLKTTAGQYQCAYFSANSNVVLGIQAALSTTAVDGFVHIPTCAGTPTGTPNLYTGKVPMIYDTTNRILYIYAGGAWRAH